MKKKIIQIILGVVIIFYLSLLFDLSTLEAGESAPVLTINKIIQQFEDRENGGFLHTLTEDLNKPINPNKYSQTHFSIIKNYLLNFLLRGDPTDLEQAEKCTLFTFEKFEDKEKNGFYTATSKNWVIIDDSKETTTLAEASQILFQLYESTKNEKYLLKGFSTLDLLLNQCWDEKNGGFFNSFTSNWEIKSPLKSLSVQIKVLMALEAGWKNSLDSKYAGKAEFYRQKAREIADLIKEKMYDSKYGGFYHTCNPDWTVKDNRKDTRSLFETIIAFSIHYNEFGPMISGTKKGESPSQLKFSPIIFPYRNPLPSNDPIGMDSYNFIKIAKETASLLIKKAWDEKKGGFFNICTQNWELLDSNKDMQTHSAAINALNVLYQLTGTVEFKEKLNQILYLLDGKAEGETYPGFFDIYNFNWEPIHREKRLLTNLEIYSSILTARPTLKTNVPRIRFKIWINPENITIKEGEAAEYKITIQNQGFNEEKIRVGGFTSFTSWMSPKELLLEIPPHQIATYTLQIRPPFGLMHKKYHFEISVVPLKDTSQYFSSIASVTIE